MKYSGVVEIFILSVISISQADLEYDGKVQIRLEHALDNAVNPEFTYRGDVSVKSLYSGSSAVEQISLTSSEAAQLKELARKGEIYRLKAIVKTPDGKQTDFFTFVPACSIVESELSDMLYVNLDHVGNVIAVTLATNLPCTFKGEFQQHLNNFNTAVYIRHMDLGPVPDTASYIQKLEQERESKERGETKDNRSFLAKYWMYILPVVIFLLISSASNPDGGAGGQ